jgi:hypothetical protein
MLVVQVNVLSMCPTSYKKMLWKWRQDTFVVVVSTVEAALELVWASVLVLDLVVE